MGPVPTLATCGVSGHFCKSPDTEKVYFCLGSRVGSVTRTAMFGNRQIERNSQD